MDINGTCSKNPTSELIFNDLKNLSKEEIYPTLYEYLKKVTQEFSQEQPFYVLDLADILWKIQLWKENFPHIKPYYAVKANCDPELIKFLVLLGLSFDCSTKGEIDLVLEKGGNPKHIIYAHTMKPPSSLEYASNVGVDFMTFDCKEELLKIQKHYPTAKLLLRIKPENPHCSFDLSIKYGCPVDETEEILKLAKRLSLNVIGVSFHVGALCEDVKSFTKSIFNCREVFNLAQSLGFQFTILDLGAGFFGSKEKEICFPLIAKEINGALKQYFSEDNIQVIAEPGCYFVGSSQKTITCIIGKKLKNTSTSTDQCTRENEIHYYLNDGFYGSFFKQFEVYDIYAIPLLETGEYINRQVYKSKVWGQTCCAEDLVLDNYTIPEMEIGEYIVWENMGAYTLSLWSTFTVVPIPKPKYIFIKNTRLYLDWIENLKTITEFMVEKAVFIEREYISEFNLISKLH